MFSWSIVIEHGTVLEQCAIDALLTVESKDGDYWKYVTDDKEAWIEFQKYQIANKRLIDKESFDHYRY